MSARGLTRGCFSQFSLPVRALRLKEAEGLGERCCATVVVESSSDRLVNREADAGARLSSEPAEGPAHIAEGERRCLEGGPAGVAGRPAGVLAGLNQVRFAVELAAVRVRTASLLARHSGVAAAGQVAQVASSVVERTAPSTVRWKNCAATSALTVASVPLSPRTLSPSVRRASELDTSAACSIA